MITSTTIYAYLPWRCRAAYASCQALWGRKFGNLRDLEEVQYRNMVSARVLWPCKGALLSATLTSIADEIWYCYLAEHAK